MANLKLRGGEPEVRSAAGHIAAASATRFIVSSAVTILAVVMLASVAGVAHAARPSVIKFGFPYNQVDSFFQYDGAQLYAGLKAAEKEINDNDLLHGVNISFVHVAMPSFTAPAATSVTTLATAYAVNSFTGFVLSDWVSSAFAKVVSQMNGMTVPVMAARSISVTEYTPASPYVMSLRQPLPYDYVPLLYHGLAGPETQCAKFIVFTRSFFPSVFSLINATLRKLSLETPTLVPFGVSVSDFNASNLLNEWFVRAGGNRTDRVPRCALLFGTSVDVAFLVGNVSVDPRFQPIFPYIHFYSSSLSFTPQFLPSDPALSPTIFANVHLMSNFPDPNSPNPLPTAYRAAMANWLATSPVVPAPLNIHPVEPAPNSVSLEGYIAGSFVGKVLSRVLSVSGSDIINSVYDNKNYWLGDTIYGPFNDHCLVGGDGSVVPCFCNVAALSAYLVNINTTTGVPTSTIHARDALEASTLSLTANPDICFLDDSSIRKPVSLHILSALNLSPLALQRTTAFYNVFRAASNAVNQANSFPTVLFNAAWANQPGAGYVNITSSTNVSLLLEEIVTLHRPTAVISTYFPTVNTAIWNIIASPSTDYEDKPLTPATEFSWYTWTLKPTLADLVHVLSSFLGLQYAGAPKLPQVLVYSDNALGLQLAIDSLHTYQFPVSVGEVKSLATLAVATSVVSSAFTAALTGSVVLMISSVTPTVTVNIISAMDTLLKTLSSDDLALLNTNLVVCIGADQGSFLTAKLSAVTNVTLLQTVPILFGSFLYPFWELTNSYRLQLSQLTNSTSPTHLENVAEHTALLIVRLMEDLVNTANVPYPEAADILSAMYEKTVSSANGVIIGPVYNQNCTNDIVATGSRQRSCQCFKPIRTLRVYDFRDWATNGQLFDPDYQWSMPTCGVVYSPLLVASSLNVALVAGVVAPCGSCLFIVAYYFMCCYGRRSNRTAPKDPQVPFAMVFTDIQSSTSLWARAPDAMGPSLDKHHELLRNLVSEHNGYEVKTIGDSFMVAFQRAKDAAAFALAIQTALYEAQWPDEIDDTYIALAQEAYEEFLMNEDPKKQAERLSASGGSQRKLQQWEDEVNYPLLWNGIRVRVGLHWGVGSVKLDPVSQGYDYYGTLVNTAARVEGVGNGGQVLATKDFYDELEKGGEFDFSHVDVLPLGPQPLRGLDQPIPLYQLSPERFKARQFAALRLDMEVADELSECSASEDGRTVSSAHDTTPDAMIERLVKREKDAATLADYFSRVCFLLETAFRTSTIAWRKETVKHLAKKWRVQQRRQKSNESTELALSYDIAAVVVRVGLAAEEARKASLVTKVDGISSAGRSSQKEVEGATLTRRQSKSGGWRRRSSTKSLATATVEVSE